LTIQAKTTTTKTLKVSGVSQSAPKFKEFFAAIPDRAKIDISVSLPMKGEFGSAVSTIEASWDEE
jgi:hypothetical protein